MQQSRTLRAAVVGASSLLGKELAEQMADATEQVWDVTLLDTEEASGKIAAAGEQALLVQPLAPGAFERMDAVFFAGDGEAARTHWKEAQSSGAVVVDLTGALRQDGVARVLAPAAVAGETRVVTPVHPAALMLAGVALSLRKFGGVRLVATVLAPASEWGKAGVDELQRQTVGLLSFQSVPKELFDEQVAFNLTPRFGQEAGVSLEELAATIERDFLLLAAGCELTVQVVQAPVFHGYAISAFVAAPEQIPADEMQSAFSGSFVQLTAEGEAPSNVSVAGEKGIFARMKQSAGGYWFWLAADNVALLAQTAIASARELARAG